MNTFCYMFSGMKPVMHQSNVFPAPPHRTYWDFPGNGGGFLEISLLCFPHTYKGCHNIDMKNNYHFVTSMCNIVIKIIYASNMDDSS